MLIQSIFPTLPTSRPVYPERVDVLLLGVDDDVSADDDDVRVDEAGSVELASRAVRVLKENNIKTYTFSLRKSSIDFLHCLHTEIIIRSARVKIITVVKPAWLKYGYE